MSGPSGLWTTGQAAAHIFGSATRANRRRVARMLDAGELQGGRSRAGGWRWVVPASAERKRRELWGEGITDGNPDT